MAQHITTANFIYGTAWKKHRTASLVYAALRCGFRAIDSAAHPEHYDEAGVGDGLRRAVVEGIVRRQDLSVGLPIDSPHHALPIIS